METVPLPPPSDKVLPEDRCCTPSSLHHFSAAQIGTQQEEVGLGHIQRAGSLALWEIFHALFPPSRNWEYWSPADAQEEQGDEDTGKSCSLYQREQQAGPAPSCSLSGPKDLSSREKELCGAPSIEQAGPGSYPTCSCPLPNTSRSCLQKDLDIPQSRSP